VTERVRPEAKVVGYDLNTSTGKYRQIVAKGSFFTPNPAVVALGTTVSEKELQSQVVRMARAFGWMAFHPWDSRRSEWGFPDLTLARRGVVLFAELKSATGRLTPAQEAWAAELPNWHLWRPDDLLDGTIEKELR